jgi:putative chitinase
MTDWLKVIKKIAPTALPSIAQGLADAMPQVIKIANLSTQQRVAQFLAQIAHESAGFKTTTEYASGKAYEGRRDLGNVQSGDGVRFKGRGLIQITGRANYAAMGKALGQDFIKEPSEAADFPWAALTAAVYWKKRQINRFADKNDLRAVTRAINGGFNGLADRQRYLKLAMAAVPDDISPAINVFAAQKKLAALSYPLGSVDGQIGPLTRSAIRDFQDAMGEPVTGQLDQRTYDILMSDSALKRPVSEDRENITADDLKASGSTTIQATDSIKSNIAVASSALAGASGVATQITDAAGQVQSIKDAVKTGHESVPWFVQNWQMITIVVLVLIVIYCVIKIWKCTSNVENERVRQARSGENVRV